MFGAILGAVAAPLIGGAVSSIFAPDSPSSGPGSASAAADPFASQRAQYQQQLAALMNAGDPSAAMLQPGYHFQNPAGPSWWEQSQPGYRAPVASQPQQQPQAPQQSQAPQQPQQSPQQQQQSAFLQQLLQTQHDQQGMGPDTNGFDPNFLIHLLQSQGVTPTASAAPTTSQQQPVATTQTSVASQPQQTQPVTRSPFQSEVGPPPSSQFLPNSSSGQSTTSYPSGQSAAGGNTQAMLQPGYNFQTSDPSYAWRLQQGLSALQRGLAQTGQTASGNEMAQLQQYGQGMASQEFSNEFNRQHSSQALTDQEAATAFNQHQAAQALTDQEFSNLFNMQQTEYANQFSRLAQLSGANVGSPGTAGQLQANQNMQQQQAASAVGNAVGNAAGNWLGNYMGDNSTTPASGPAFPVTQAGYQFNSQPILSGGTDLNAFAGYNF